MYLSQKTKNLLKEKLGALNKLRPINKTLLNKIRENFQIEMTYNSNAIEGNTLTKKETFWIISEGLTIKGKSLKEHLEVKNHKEALDFLYELIDINKKNTISEYLIKQIHSLAVKEADSEIAGIYRNGDVFISGSDHKPPSGFEVPGEMEKLIKWIKKEKNNYHIVELSAILHHKLVAIHPFWDGNGRASRIIMNILIMNAGYPMAIILKNDRRRYYRVLSEADNGDYKNLCEFLAQSAIRSLNIYLDMLKPSKKKEDKLLTLAELSKYCNYSPAYLKKLAINNKLEAVKKERNWYSSKKAVDDYIKLLK
ncbi:MAG: Fic family protein [Patescibacteria group bacterium]|nr:Fic family protein [Patescibacteria group bacterium]